MKINNPYGINKPSDVNRKKRVDGTSSSDFASMIEDSASETHGATASSPMAPLDAMIALQQISDEELGRSKGAKYANDLLDSLSNLKNDILMGEISHARLAEIEQRIKSQKEFVADPALSEILGEIETRAAVEIAKARLYS